MVGKAFGDDRVIDFPLTEVKRLAGIDVPLAEMKRILGHLGFMMAGSGPVVKVAVPSWRSDVSRQGRHRRGDRAHRRRRQGADDAVRSRRRAAQAGPDADPVAHPPRQARAGRARHGRGRDVVVHLQTACRIVRPRSARGQQPPRPSRTLARQSDRSRSVRHAAEPAAGSGRRRAGQYRSRLFRIWRCSRSARSSPATSRKIN